MKLDINRIIHAIILDETEDILKYDRNSIASHRFKDDILFVENMTHQIYIDDTLLHLAAAGHKYKACGALLRIGCDVKIAESRRKSTPLHYASEGAVGSLSYNEANQIRTVKILLRCGAEIDCPDSNGATPLHKAVRARCNMVVDVLLSAGCSPNIKNKNGSSPLLLARVNSGRGGTGTEEARNRGNEIIKSLLRYGAK